MDSTPERPEPAQLRIGDAERHQVAELLREAAGQGRLDLEELDERLESTYAARTYADLVPITADLVPHPAVTPMTPASPRSTNPVVGGGARTESGVAIMSGFERKGVWRMPERLNAFCLMGGADIDLRQAEFAAHEVTINAVAIMGGVDIVVGPTTRVVMEGIGIMGGFDGPTSKKHQALEELGPDSPVLRVTGVALMGGVTVRRRPMPEDEPPRRMLGLR